MGFVVGNSRKAFAQDMRKFAQWFTMANKEPLCIKRVTVRDITDCGDDLINHPVSLAFVSKLNSLCRMNLNREMAALSAINEIK